MNDAPVVPRDPPRLLPGHSAAWWNSAGTLVVVRGMLFLLGFVLLAWPLAQVATGTAHDIARETLLLLGCGCVAAQVPLAWVYRHRVFRERDAGYTTMPGDAVTMNMSRGPAVMLFRTADLWQLEGRTGAVVRRPGGATPEAWRRHDAELQDFEDTAERLGRAR